MAGYEGLVSPISSSQWRVKLDDSRLRSLVAFHLARFAPLGAAFRTDSGNKIMVAGISYGPREWAKLGLK